MSDERDPVYEDMGHGALPDPEDARHQRAREPRHKEPPTYRPPNVVTQAKCQMHAHGCPGVVDVTDEGIGMMQTFDKILIARGEKPLDLNECFPCPSCHRTRAAAAAHKSAQRREKTTEAIRYLKNIPLDDVNTAHDLGQTGKAVPLRVSDTVVKAMERLGWLGRVHGGGYVSDLVNAMRERVRSGGKSKPRKEDL